MQQPPYAPMPAPPPKRRLRRSTWLIGAGVLILSLLVCALCTLTTNMNTSNQSDTTTIAPTPTSAGSHMVVIMTQHSPTASIIHPTVIPKSVPPSRPTPSSSHYPPTTVEDLHSLATEGDARAIHEFHSESVGLTGVCPQPKREVTIGSSVTGQQLAEDLLAYFYAQQLDSPCGSIVFAYHNQGEADNAYTAGRISVDVTDSSGTTNLDPNASGLSHKLTLDIGGLGEGQEYVVTY